MKLVISLVKRLLHAVIGDLVFTRPPPEALRVQVCRLNMHPFCGCAVEREGTIGHLSVEQWPLYEGNVISWLHTGVS